MRLNLKRIKEAIGSQYRSTPTELVFLQLSKRHNSLGFFVHLEQDT